MLCLIQVGQYKYKLNAQSLRLIGLHSDVNDAHRAGANRPQNKTKKQNKKPRRPSTTCSSTRTVPIRERIWIDIESGAQSDQAYPVAKRLNTLLRHGELPREEDGATEFWRPKDEI